MNTHPHLDELFELLRFPSISTDREHAGALHQCADWLVAKANAIGLTAEKFATPGHPVVVARSRPKPDRPTVLIYGHYDVQPVDPVAEWKTPPFEPTVIDGRIYCRGATDNKGQHFAHFCGVADALAEEGDLPVNAIFLIEGEEEIGSRHLEAFLRDHAADLKSDICAVSDTGMIGPGIPTLTYGLRGICCLEFTVRGPLHDLHSGVYGGAVANPAAILGKLLASLHDSEGRVQIAGFYDEVEPLQDWEREMWAKLPGGDSATLTETGVPTLWGEAGYTALERRWARPTAEVNGLGGGYQGPGSKTVIPREAMAKLSFRLAPRQDPERILELAARHLRLHCPPSCRIEIEKGHSGSWYVMDPHSDYGKTAQAALRSTFGKEPCLIREGGSIPIIQSIKDVLGIDSLLLGLALPDGQIHAPNENFTIENFDAGIRLNRALLKEIGQM